MSRIEELKAMKGPQLIIEADKLGVKVVCDRKKNKLTEAKAKLIDRILAFEAEQNIKSVIEEMEGEPAEGIQEGTFEEMEGAEELEQPEAEVAPQETPSAPKRGALIEWNGKAQNICAWAKELGISANTLYGRIYKLGWTVDKAFTKKGRK